MYVAVIILKDEVYAKTVVSTLIEMALFEATVLDGDGLEYIAGESMPILSEVSVLFGRDILFNKTIIVAVPDKETIFRLNAALKRDGIDFKQPEVGSLMAFPCPVYIGAEYGDDD